MESLRSYLAQNGEGTRWRPTPGVVVVGSGKGGIGTSTVATLLALVASQDGRKVLLVDGDEGVGSLHHLLGLPDGGPGLGALRDGGLDPADLVRGITGSLSLLPGGGGGVEATLATALGERRALLRRVAGLYEGFDLVVVDGGSHLGSVLAACYAGAERLLALTSPDRVSMAATYALLKVGRERFPALPMEVVVNHGQGVGAEEVFQMMAQAGERFLGLKVAWGGSVPRDATLAAVHEKGEPLLALPPSSPALDAAGALHGRLASEQLRTAGEAGGTIPFSASP
jgi:MinD-like ATPase involved in chromosome partitioning or flagellar assembly